MSSGILRGKQTLPISGGRGIFLFRCFLAACANTPAPHLNEVNGAGQKHQNRLMPWWSFAPKKNFFFSFCPLFRLLRIRLRRKFFVFRNTKKIAMSKESKTYKNMPKKIYIRTFGWPLVCSHMDFLGACN